VHTIVSTWGIQESDFGVSVELKTPAIIIKMSLLVCFHRLRGSYYLPEQDLAYTFCEGKIKLAFLGPKGGACLVLLRSIASNPQLVVKK
jgi:hypothetical protein